MDDDSPMPFGKFKGEKLRDVPASYLLWLYDEFEADPPERKRSQELKAYIDDNLEVLRMERNRE